jgi:RNA polymerase sigma factor (sigma-70 family)
MINRIAFAQFIDTVYHHSDFSCYLERYARKFADWRRTKEAADIVQDVRLEIENLIKRGLRATTCKSFWRRLRKLFLMNLCLSSSVSHDGPLPPCIIKEISKLCSNLTPRQNRRTPRPFHEHEAQQIVHQGSRGCPDEPSSQDPLEILIKREEEKAQVEEKRRRRLKERFSLFLAALGPRERDLTLAKIAQLHGKEIAAALEITQGRVSQMWKQIKIKFWEKGPDYCFAD